MRGRWPWGYGNVLSIIIISSSKERYSRRFAPCMVVHVAHLVLSDWQPTAYCNHIGGGAGSVGGARALA